jgi:hypothetical protein
MGSLNGYLAHLNGDLVRVLQRLTKIFEQLAGLATICTPDVYMRSITSRHPGGYTASMFAGRMELVLKSIQTRNKVLDMGNMRNTTLNLPPPPQIPTPFSSKISNTADHWNFSLMNFPTSAPFANS